MGGKLFHSSRAETWDAKLSRRAGLSSAASAANAAVDHIRDWVFGTRENDWVSMGIPSDGSYGIPEGVMYGFPVICKEGGTYQIVPDLEISESGRKKMACDLSGTDGRAGFHKAFALDKHHSAVYLFSVHYDSWLPPRVFVFAPRLPGRSLCRWQVASTPIPHAWRNAPASGRFIFPAAGWRRHRWEFPILLFRRWMMC